jgi:hypothetical protein
LALQEHLNQTAPQDGSLSEVLLKFDIYFSRVQTVLSHTATVKDFVAEREEFDTRLEIIRNNLSSVTPLVDALRPGDLAGLAQMNALMAEVMPDIRYVVVTAVQTWQRRAQMLRTMPRMTKAFIMGNSDAVMAEIILVSSFTRPKSRTTLNARISRTSQSGMLKGPKSSSDMVTMKRSNQFHPLRMNLYIQLANILTASSIAKTTVNIRFMLRTKSSNSWELSCLNCASNMEIAKFC